jgi:hypothetical protein
VTAEYVRETYSVPAKVGMRVVADGMPGTIVGFAGHYLRVRLDGASNISTWHPTWNIRYPEVTE